MDTSNDLTHRRDPEADKQRALKLAAKAAAKATTTEQDRNLAIRFAAESGASLRELEQATGIPFNTVRRIIERQKTDVES